MINLTILGATGSIGVNTLDVVASNPQNYRIVALTAHSNVEKLFNQCVQHQPAYAVLVDPDAALKLEKQLRAVCPNTKVLTGCEALDYVASLPEVDCVMASIVGGAGLLSTLAAVRAGKRVLLANKESLVMAGPLFIDEVQRHNALLLPIDSEHNAILQCLPDNFTPGVIPAGVQRIILTASGGAFRDVDLNQLAHVTPEQACAHPNWNMGRKITVDCATMMNKALEVIEAHWLFGLAPEQIQVVLHPQSTVHSLVEYLDGSMLAQLGNPDMRIPIAHALGWPVRIKNAAAKLDLLAVGRLDFAPLNAQRYPCLDLAYAALQAGGTATAILNAANEVAVQAFLNGQLGFTDIFTTVAKVLDKLPCHPATHLEVILEDDRRARAMAQSLITEKSFLCRVD